MKGNNEFSLNQATMCEALQLYFDTVLFASGKAPHVEKIGIEKGVGYGQDCFFVKLTEKEPNA